MASVANTRPIPPLSEETIARFWSHVGKASEDECWPWAGAKQKSGRGFTSINDVNFIAPRVAWAIANGRSPDGMMVCHSCDNPNCVNPAHLWLGTCADNTNDCIRKGRYTNVLRDATHCKRGHALSGDNLVLRTGSWGGTERLCRACDRIRKRQYRQRKREAAQ